MVVPTITAISPVSGLTSGQTLVTIDGTNFRITSPFMEVKFGSTLATLVRVLSTTKLTCKTPVSNLGLVDITVKNLSTSESVTSTGAYTYKRPDLTLRYHLSNTVDTLIRELRRQVVENVSLTTNTDFDRITGDGLNIIELSTLPALLIIGPNLPVNRFYSTNERPVVQSGTTFDLFNQPFTTDLEFRIVGIDDHPERLLNLLYVTNNFFQKNEFLNVDKDPLNPSAGQVSYEMDVDPEGFSHDTGANIFNVHVFNGSFTIRGFNFEDGEIAEQAFEIVEEILTTEQFNP